MITERLDESLVVLKLLLGLDFRSIAYIPMKIAPPTNRSRARRALVSGVKDKELVHPDK